jgi:hypothetical protein
VDNQIQAEVDELVTADNDAELEQGWSSFPTH